MHNEDAILRAWIDKVQNAKVFKYHKKINEIRKFWTKVYTGENQDEIVLRTYNSLSKKMKEQRIAITNTLSPYLCGKLVSEYRIVDRTDKLRDILRYESNNSKDIAELEERVRKNYYGDLGVNDFLRQYLLVYAIIDPNAFFLTNFYPFDAKKEKPYSYPTIIGSESIVDYRYTNNTLDYLAFKEIKVDESEQEIEIHYLYTKERNYKIEVSSSKNRTYTNFESNPSQVSIAILKANQNILELSATKKDTRYILEVNEPKVNYVPAIQVGWNVCPINGIHVRLSAFNDAKYPFTEIIQSKSQYDVHMRLHGIAKELAYIPRCNGVKENKPCIDGKIGNDTCHKCKGTGKMPLHRSEDDIITIELPFNKDNTINDEIISLEKLHHYIEIPEHIIRLRREDLEIQEKRIALAMFNTNVFDKSQSSAKTATEAGLNYQSVYNGVEPYANKFAEVAVFIRHIIAEYADLNKDLVNELKFPDNYASESINELLAQRSAAVTSGATVQIIRSIDDSIMHKQHIDDHINLQRLRSIEKLKPFFDKSEVERNMSLSMLPEKDIKRIAYLYFDDIILDMDNYNTAWFLQKFESQRQLFYQLASNYRDRYIENLSVDPIVAPFDIEDLVDA